MLSCAESAVKDIGIMGTAKGWKIMVGGNAGARPRLGDVLVDNVPSEEEVLTIVARVIDYYKNSSNQNRIGRIIEEIGIERFREEVLGRSEK
jgi:NAD(P)H-nitrite reductase large subunit